MNNPKVSIIIPNYNHSSFLKQRIDSVLSQTYQNFEVLILDDCSTDNSREIIEQYKEHPQISHFIYNDFNSGSVFKQWIKGIEYASGDYIWIAESDDYSSDLFLEETVKLLDTKLSLGAVFTNTIAVDEKGQFINNNEILRNDVFKKLSKENYLINRENLSEFLIADMIILNASSVLFRKDILMTIDFNELSQFNNTGDRFVYIGIALFSDILYIPQSLNFMRSHKNNTTQKNMQNGNIHKDRIKVLYYYFDKIPNTSKNIKQINQFYLDNYLYFIYYGDYKENIEVLIKLKQSKSLNSLFYLLVRFNLYIFKKLKVNSRILRGIYYRILVMYQKIAQI